jgi:alkyl sulfatase BDS1-like metallo-beta-lactamase superfamily hydrolase
MRSKSKFGAESGIGRRPFPAAALLAAGSLALLLLAGCGKNPPAEQAAAPGSTGVEAATAGSNQQFGQALNLAETQDFDDAARGLIARPSGKILNADGSTLWDFERFNFVKGDAPASSNPSLWRQAKLNNNAGLFKVTEGIYQLRGFDLANITLIDGDTGWIVVDTLTSRQTAAAAMAFARKHLGDKKVSALIFTHSHVDHFGGALGVISGEEAAQRKVPIVAPEGFLEEATSENVLLGPSMGRRAAWMYGTRLPASAAGLIDDGLGKSVALGAVGILPPTQIVSTATQEMMLDGVKFVFYNAPGSEAPAEMAFYLPEKQALCAAELLTHTLHNLYTLRGAKVRDALRWSGYIDDFMQRFGQSEVVFASHHWPIWGNARIIEYMKKHRDVFRYIHDQTIRMVNAGMKPDQIADTLKLPKSLEGTFSIRGYYGTVRHNARAVYQNYVGWFDGNPANLDTLPRTIAAKRYVELMGGIDKLVAAAQSAFDRGEYRWTAELLNHAVFAQPEHKAAKELLARTYDQLGYVAESGPWRNVYLTGAYELRNGPPEKGLDRTVLLDMLAWTPIERFLDAMAASLDGPGAEGKELRVNLVFTDIKESYVLWLENAVLHHRKAPAAGDADATLTLTKPMFLKMMTGSAKAEDVLLSDELKTSGSKVDLVRFFSLFDKAEGIFPVVTP